MLISAMIGLGSRTTIDILFVKGEEGRETTGLFTKLNKWYKDRRFIVSLVLKPEKDRVQLLLIEGEEYQYFFFFTNTELSSENVHLTYGKVVIKMLECRRHLLNSLLVNRK